MTAATTTTASPSAKANATALPVAATVLNCANPSSLSTIEEPFALGPLDATVVPFCPIPVLFVYLRPEDTPAESFLPVSRLKQALEIVLDAYPHLTGRIKLDTQGVAYPSIVKLGTGGALYTATRDETVDSLRGPTGRVTMPDLPECGVPLLPPWAVTLEGVQEQPILLVKHTRFACGSVALGITLHHYVCDAGGYFQFVRDIVNVYAALRAGKPPSVPQPAIESYHKSDLSPADLEEALKTQPPKLALEEQTSADPTADGHSSFDTIHPTNMPPVRGRVLRFTSSELARIKADALGTAPWVSTHEALVAHIWKRTYAARVALLEGRASEATTLFNRNFLSSINLRGKRLGLPKRYFPNSIYAPVEVLDHEFLLNSPLPDIAAAIHNAYREQTPEIIEHSIRWIAAQQAAGKIKNVRTTFNYGSGSYVVTQWTSFRMYEGVAFDGADPALVSQPFTEVSLLDGLAMMFSTEVPGEIDVNLTLSEPVWELLDKDPEFRQHQE